VEYFTSLIDDLDWPDVPRRNDKRQEPRLSRSLLISIQPLTHDFKDVGETLQAVTCDTSVSGMGFLCNDPIKLEFVRISIPGSRVSVIAEVRHSRLIGGVPVVFQYGVEYMKTPANVVQKEADREPATVEIPVLTIL
jgi:hypothetical protein